MATQYKANATVWQVGLWSFLGVFFLGMFACLFIGVNVYPSVHWYLHTPDPMKIARALVASAATGAVLSFILMAGTVLLNRLGARQVLAGWSAEKLRV